MKKIIIEKTYLVSDKFSKSYENSILKKGKSFERNGDGTLIIKTITYTDIPSV